MWRSRGPLVERGRRVWEREVHLFKTLAWHAGKVKVKMTFLDHFYDFEEHLVFSHSFMAYVIRARRRNI